MALRIVSRREWGAADPTKRYTMPTPTPRLWIHHTALERRWAAGVRETQRFHMKDRGWSDIAYSYLVDDDGTVYEGRGAGVVGAHTSGDNSRSHAIAAMGNFELREPPQRMLDAIADLARHGRQAGWWGGITGAHRDAPGASTACCGRHLYKHLPAIRSAAAVEEDDMTEEDRRMLREVHQWMGRIHHDLVADNAPGERTTRGLVEDTETKVQALTEAAAPFVRRFS